MSQQCSLKKKEKFIFFSNLLHIFKFVFFLKSYKKRNVLKKRTLENNKSNTLKMRSLTKQ